jgi:hypothetical protein
MAETSACDREPCGLPIPRRLSHAIIAAGGAATRRLPAGVSAFLLWTSLAMALGLAACGSAASPAAIQASPAAIQASPEPATRTGVAAAATRAATATPTAPVPTPTATVVPTEPAREPAATVAPTDVVPAPAATATTRPGYYSREALIADARQLAAVVERTHPDPYVRGGGKVAFHLRLDRLLHAIPEGGMDRDGFIRLLRPFLAAIGDSHTELWSDYDVSQAYPGGIPVRFGIVEKSLYVAGVLDPAHRSLIGAILTSVEGVPLSELLARQRALVPLENDYHVLEEMASHTLWYGPYLEDALPEWQDPGQIVATFERPSGESEQVTFALPVRATRTYWPDSAVDLPPAPDHGFSYTMWAPPAAVEPIAYLRVDHMEGFREASEAMGDSGAGLPSATETFRDLVIEMAEAGTDTLVVDLRADGGGSSLMADILIYFLYGKEALTSIQDAMLAAGGQVDRISALCFTPPNNIGRTLAQINEGRSVPIELGGYDFRQFFSGDADEFQAYLAGMAEPPSMAWYRATPTFLAEYESGAYAGFYLPDHVLVLVSPWTFSSGLTMARDLSQAGATLVGTPSAQSSNSFGNGLLWHLDNTGLEGQVTRSYFRLFPEESGLGEVWPVDYPLTYDRLASYGFDPDATLLYALDLLPELPEG